MYLWLIAFHLIAIVCWFAALFYLPRLFIYHSLSDDQIKISKRTKLIIPAGTYAGQSSDITTTSLPVVAYATTNMSKKVAYNLTKAYWENKGKLGEAAKWWNGVTPEMISNVSTKVHSGAVKYYEERGVKLADHHK
mgnify:CR=1 FL=1